MRVEHVALQVESPAEMAAWYCEHLGMTVVRQKGDTCFFLADENGQVVFEIYYNPAAKVPDYRAMDPLELHLAFASDDARADVERLAAAGAEVVGDLDDIRPGDGGSTFAVVRDPWGLPVQVVTRVPPLM